jgi:hypothetical protein
MNEIDLQTDTAVFITTTRKATENQAHYDNDSHYDKEAV